MYMKVALSAFTLILLSGCVSQKELNTPKKEQPVVEVVEETTTTITPLKEKATVKESKGSKRAPHLKPEPFSLESNEDDPELLGPQTTLSNPLTKEEDNSTESI